MSKSYSGYGNLPYGQSSGKLLHASLALEGGAFRGVYTCGVLDAFLEADLNFSYVAGVSAGALNGMNYVSGQIGRSARANLGYRHDSRYVGLRSMKENAGVIGFHFLFEEFESIYPFDRERFFRPEQKFYAVCTALMDGRPRYYEKNSSDIYQAIRASASMPLVSKPVDVDGTLCLDGGSAVKVPYRLCLDYGHGKTVVIRTREKTHRREEKELESAYAVYHAHPQFARVFANSDRESNRECDEMDALEKEGRIFVIAPSRPVEVSRLESDMEKLGDLYRLGYTDGKAAIPAMLEYLGIATENCE